MIEILLQATPTSDLPSDWAMYIIITLLGFIGSIFMFLKWLIGLASKKTDSVIKDFKAMHSEGIAEIKAIRESQIKTEFGLMEMKTDFKETKYAVQTLNTKIKCKEAS